MREEPKNEGVALIYHVFVSDVPFVSGVLAEVKSQAGVLDLYNSGGNGSNRKFGVGRTGRYVRVQLEARAYLHMAEVEVYVNPTGGQASLLFGDEEVLVTAIAPRLDIEAVADDQLIVDAKGGMTPTLRPSFFRGPLETLPGAMRVVVSWANRQTSEHALAIDAISDDLAPDALAESTLREERRATSNERPAISSPAPRDPRPASLSASAASVTGARRYSLYSPEMNLLSETEYTDAATPPIQHDYVWFAGAPVAQVTHSVPSEPLAAPEVVWTVTDHLGTPRIQTDDTGAIVWHAEHEPYGRIYLLREGEGRHQPLRFPGQEAEQLGVNAANGITNRYYNVFRWYRAAEGRYTQSDPLGRNGDLHPYLYAQGDPLGVVDPTGEKSRVCCTPVMEGPQPFHHCFIHVQSEAGENSTYSLHRMSGGIFFPGQGCTFEDDSFDMGALDNPSSLSCGAWSECADGCTSGWYNAYPKSSDYMVLGKNSNTFASHVAFMCGLDTPPIVGEKTPGWKSSPDVPNINKKKCPASR